MRLLLASYAISSSLSFACLPAIGKDRVSDEAIVIGQSAPFSGPSAQLGTDFNLGARTYFQMVNDNGGVHGRKIELRAKDDAYDSNLTVQNTNDMLDKEHVLALFGYVGTTTTLAALPVITAAQVPFFAPVTGCLLYTSPSPRD